MAPVRGNLSLTNDGGGGRNLVMDPYGTFPLLSSVISQICEFPPDNGLRTQLSGGFPQTVLELPNAF